MIRTGSRSFFLASMLLPDEIRGGAYALYGFCRLSDDAIDVEGGSAETVGRLRRRLDLVYAGQPSPEPVDRALADAVLVYGIPRAAMDALLEGLEWDVSGRTYDSLSDVRAYAARVAGSVGAMMAALMSARRPDLVARACDLGVAMQLTNIARDVGEDARAGRLYLPRDWFHEAGIDPDGWLTAPTYRPEIGAFVDRLLGVAGELYARADVGIAGLAPRFRPAIFAARHLYAAIGARVAANKFDSVSTRARVSFARKTGLIALAVSRAARTPPPSFAPPPSPETRFLVEAVSATPAVRRPDRAGRGRVESDLIWTLDLFSSLGRRPQVQ